MIRRFVNLVAENYKTGVYSLHRLDVSEHLFHQSRADARVVPPLLAAGAQQGHTPAGGGDEQPPMLERLNELPAAMTTWSSSNVDYFTLWGSRCEEDRILCLNKVGTAVVFEPHSNSNFIVPGLNNFKGPVLVSVSVAPAAAGDKEQQLYILHGGPELNHDYHFNALRYRPGPEWSSVKGWHWHSLPVPPFVDDLQYKYKPAIISAYAAVDGGNTICLSSVAEGTYCLNTMSCEWKRAGDWVRPFSGKANTVSCEWKRVGDWVLPFCGKAEYISDLNLWLGFSHSSPGCLCAASDILMDREPTSLIVWPHHTPKEWMTVDAKLLSLGSGKFAVAKVFRVVTTNTEQDTVEDHQVVVLSGVELEFGGKDNNTNLQGLKLFQHKSICYTCANSTAIRFVL